MMTYRSDESPKLCTASFTKYKMYGTINLWSTVVGRMIGYKRKFDLYIYTQTIN